MEVTSPNADAGHRHGRVRGELTPDRAAGVRRRAWRIPRTRSTWAGILVRRAAEWCAVQGHPGQLLRQHACETRARSAWRPLRSTVIFAPPNARLHRAAAPMAWRWTVPLTPGCCTGAPRTDHDYASSPEPGRLAQRFRNKVIGATAAMPRWTDDPASGFAARRAVQPHVGVWCLLVHDSRTYPALPRQRHHARDRSRSRPLCG